MEYNLHDFIYDMLFSKDHEVRNGNAAILKQISSSDHEHLAENINYELENINSSSSEYEMIMKSTLMGVDVNESHARKLMERIKNG